MSRTAVIPTKAKPFLFDRERDTWVCLHHGDQDSSGWVPCWSCGGLGEFDGYEEDPMWFDEGEFYDCDECQGEGGWRVCLECNADNPDVEV